MDSFAAAAAVTGPRRAREALDNITVLYGGSVNADNADSFAADAMIDGALVGGASLKAASFLAIAQAFGNGRA